MRPRCGIFTVDNNGIGIGYGYTQLLRSLRITNGTKVRMKLPYLILEQTYV